MITDNLLSAFPTSDIFRAHWTYSAPTLQLPQLYLWEKLHFSPNVVKSHASFRLIHPTVCLSSPCSSKNSVYSTAHLWNSFFGGIHKALVHALLFVGVSKQNQESQKFKQGRGRKQHKSWSFNCYNKYLGHFQGIELVLPVHYYFLWYILQTEQSSVGH